MDKVNRHLLIRGQVQGVTYRWSTQQKAQSLGIVGWVRNLPDGRVEAVVQGTEPQVNAMVQWCHQGPPKAEVLEVTIEEGRPENFSGFEIRR